MRMKIFHIITSFGFGGAERLLVNVANKMALNNDITIIILKKEYSLLSSLNNNVNVIKMDLNIFSFFKLRTILKRNQPDIIHTHLGHADLITMISSIGLSGKYFCTMHNVYFKKNSIDNIIFFLYKIFSNTIATKFQFIAISDVVYRHILNKFKISKNRIHLIYNAVAIDIAPSSVVVEDRNTFNLLFIGRLSKQKNVSLLISAISILKHKIPNIRLIIVGDGELRYSLEDQVKKLNLNSYVQFVGFSHNTSYYFLNSDLFVLPSIFEGFGLVIIESFLHRLVVLASSIEGPKELITHGFNGFLFENNDLSDLVDKTYFIYLKYHQMGVIKENAAKFAEQFSLDTYIDKLVVLYYV